jgi:hypothetical protein
MLPEIIAEERALTCNNCNCRVNFFDPCAECPNKKWGKIGCFENQEETPITKEQGLKITEMAQSFFRSTKNWAISGFKIVNEEKFLERLEKCKSCKFFDPKALKNTGRCTKCGCSTMAKLRMETEECPIGEW